MTSTTAHIRYETANDQKVIWNINRLAFDGEAEADLVDNLRSAASVEVSLVADVDGEVVGPILFSRLSISTKRWNHRRHFFGSVVGMARVSTTGDRQQVGECGPRRMPNQRAPNRNRVGAFGFLSAVRFFIATGSNVGVSLRRRCGLDGS
jgi:hypothetical protein